MRKGCLWLAATLLLAGCAQQEEEPKPAVKEEERTETEETETEESVPEQTEPETVPEEAKPAAEYDGIIYTVDGIPIINKKHGLPADYAPGEDPTAVSSLRKLLGTMHAQGLSVSDSYSGYRSYEYQSQLYSNYVAANGQASADTFSARPGYSEHQTGLAFDLLSPDGSLLTTSAEAQWLLDHAAEYGFIVRYQEGKEDITGYMAEPWHLRYIGEKASDIAASGLTLEEYLGVDGGGYIE